MTLWLGLHLPHLALDALPLAQPESAKAGVAVPVPYAVTDKQQRIFMANVPAQAAGIDAGMNSSSALAICPQLRCVARNEQAEIQLLHSLASWALQFSPRVSLAPPDEVVLEVGGSLRLFHSLDALEQRLQQALDTLGYTVRTGFAATPLAAQVLARAHDPRPVLQAADLPARLNSLPLSLMRWPDNILRRIRAVGVNTLGACSALPRAGFIKRYGQFTRTQMDQLWGQVNDPREVFTPSVGFVRSLDLLSETDNLDYLLPGFKTLFDALSAQLQGMGCGVLGLHISLAHGRQAPTRLQLSLQQPSRDAQHWMDLLHHRFERLQLAKPVRAIQLRAGDFIPLGHQQTTLWAQADKRQQQALLEQLAARLGLDALYGVCSSASHCPEMAWQSSDPELGHDDAPDTRPRPLWLLRQPQIIDPSGLSRLSPAERLESNWWDKHCQRDYHRAYTLHGQQVWVYRDHARPQRWMLHGLFG